MHAASPITAITLSSSWDGLNFGKTWSVLPCLGARPLNWWASAAADWNWRLLCKRDASSPAACHSSAVLASRRQSTAATALGSSAGTARSDAVTICHAAAREITLRAPLFFTWSLECTCSSRPLLAFSPFPLSTPTSATHHLVNDHLQRQPSLPHQPLFTLSRPVLLSRIPTVSLHIQVLAISLRLFLCYLSVGFLCLVFLIARSHVFPCRMFAVVSSAHHESTRPHTKSLLLPSLADRIIPTTALDNFVASRFRSVSSVLLLT